MNTDKPPFDDRRVREAANLAVDPLALARISEGDLQPIQQILPPGMPGYERFKLYPFNPAKARRLIAAADPEDREITVWTDTESPNFKAAAYYRRQLRKLGFTVHLKAVGSDAYSV
jgi:peptide/nickel transport system substrate-binding protein